MDLKGPLATICYTENRKKYQHLITIFGTRHKQIGMVFTISNISEVCFVAGKIDFESIGSR
jgi:hypothetical protein